MSHSVTSGKILRYVLIAVALIVVQLIIYVSYFSNDEYNILPYGSTRESSISHQPQLHVESSISDCPGEEQSDTGVASLLRSKLLGFLFNEDKFPECRVNTMTSRKRISADFYKDIFSLLEESQNVLGEMSGIKLESHDFEKLLTEEELSKKILLDDTTLDTMKKLHSGYYDNLPTELPKDLYNGSGIVFIGGEQFSWLALLSIKSLRASGSELPIEVIIPSKAEYELEFCEFVLPMFNAKCVMLDDVFHPEVIEKWQFKGYQYKSLAIIASSFDNILLLDSDNLVVSNPDSWFGMEPFSNHGLTIWPDFWNRTTSPDFYRIADITVYPERARVGVLPYLEEPAEDEKDIPFHDRRGSLPDKSSESGQLMIRKSSHTKTLLLSLYYNMFGPNRYYLLLGQGAPGDGDKDTFIAGAVKSNETFYQVKQKVEAYGYMRDNNFQGVCMGQRNPAEDYASYTKFMDKYQTAKLSAGDLELERVKAMNSSLFTIHANFPKLNPLQLSAENKLKDDSGEDFRMYGNIVKYVGFDFEVVQWERMKYLLCDLNISMRYFNSVTRVDLCQNIERHLDFLKETPSPE